MKKSQLAVLENDLNFLISHPTRRRTFLAALPFLLASCASKTQHRHREGDNAGQEVALTPAEERKMTAEYMTQMTKEYPPHQNQEAQNYINNIGQKIVQANKLHNNPYSYNFTLVDVKNVNAFALPAGTVFVTAPLFKMAETEAELAGVIGHEIGHITARHTAERMHQAKKDQSKSLIYGIGGALLGGAAGVGLGKLVCKKEDRDCLRRVALYSAAAGAGGGLLIQKFAFMANSREDEMEADRIGFKTALNAGYHKDHVGTFYAKLLTMEQEYKKNQNQMLATFTDAMSTHPPSHERVNQMNQMAATTPVKSGIISGKDFERIKKNI
jgi:predicted Zn-dependent protease